MNCFSSCARWTTKSMLVYVALAPLFGCITGSLAGSLPERNQPYYDATLPTEVSEAVKRPGANPGNKLTLSERILLVPVVYNWALEPHGGGFPPWWQIG